MAETNILVVDDEQEIADLVEIYLVSDGYKVFKASNAQDGLDILNKEDIHLCLLDIMMPELDGFSAAREIRKFRPNLPIILLSARGEEYDKIHGFELGIDDYVVKPFSPKELMMRVAAVLRRSGKAEPQENAHEVVEIQGMKVDFTARRVTVDGETVDLSPKEYELLFYMVRNRGVALTRERLIHDVWGYDFYGDTRAVDTQIKRIRQKLPAEGTVNWSIKTVYGVGYKFEVSR